MFLLFCLWHLFQNKNIFLSFSSNLRKTQKLENKNFFQVASVSASNTKMFLIFSNFCFLLMSLHEMGKKNWKKVVFMLVVTVERTKHKKTWRGWQTNNCCQKKKVDKKRQRCLQTKFFLHFHEKKEERFIEGRSPTRRFAF